MFSKILLSIFLLLFILIPISAYSAHIFEDKDKFAQFVDIALLGAEKYSIIIDENEYLIHYGWGGSLEIDIEELKGLEYPSISKMAINIERKSLQVDFTQVPDKTVMWLRLPLDLISAEKENFQLLIDGKEIQYDLTRFHEDYAIGLILPEGTQEMEIIGTNVVPEFGNISIGILGITIFTIIFAFYSKSRLLNYN